MKSDPVFIYLSKKRKSTGVDYLWGWECRPCWVRRTAYRSEEDARAGFFKHEDRAHAREATGDAGSVTE